MKRRAWLERGEHPMRVAGAFQKFSKQATFSDSRIVSSLSSGLVPALRSGRTGARELMRDCKFSRR